VAQEDLAQQITNNKYMKIDLRKLKKLEQEYHDYGTSMYLIQSMLGIVLEGPTSDKNFVLSFNTLKELGIIIDEPTPQLLKS
jgi:hypothetical protein